jgi:hypothetical protein
MFEKKCPKCGTKLVKQTYVSGGGFAPFGVASLGSLLSAATASERSELTSSEGRKPKRPSIRTAPVRFVRCRDAPQ